MTVDAVLIAGPTASGKSQAALALAEEIGGAIINADSMQVYSELNVLTARPSSESTQRLPHRLYGHVPVCERYSAGRYQNESARAFEQIREQKLVPIFVGGTGLYFSVLTEGLSPVPAVPISVRKSVRERFDTLGREAFFRELEKADPLTAAKLRPSDTQRLLRAADVMEATGRPLSAWQKMSGRAVLAGFNVGRFVIAPDRELLAERIDSRFLEMLNHGALDEARPLMGLDPTLPAAKALGLPQLWRHLAGETDLETATREAQTATRQYAKRQLTWFRNRMTDWKWLNQNEISNLITEMRYVLS